MRQSAILFGVGLLLVTAAGATAAPKDGILTGVIDRPAEVKSVVAIDRHKADKPYAATFDVKTGKFTITGLPLVKLVKDDNGEIVPSGGVYDLLIEFGESRARLEGVNLKVPRSDYEEEQPLTDEDRKALRETTKFLSKFEDTFDFLAVEGNIQHAAVLVNKLRTKPFYESKPGQIVWRLEVWHFERPDETWIKVQDELFIVHYRERLQKTDYEKKAITLDRALGGLRLTEKQPAVDLGKITLPAAKPGIRLRAEAKAARAKPE